MQGLPTGLSVTLRGSGGMARAVGSALQDAGYTSGTVIARRTLSGPALARHCGYSWQTEPAGLNADLLVNVTPIGMAGGPEVDQLAFEPGTVAGAQVVFDVVARPAQTPPIRAARQAGRPVITGAEVTALQAVEQFVRPTEAQVQAAAAYARQGE